MEGESGRKRKTIDTNGTDQPLAKRELLDDDNDLMSTQDSVMSVGLDAAMYNCTFSVEEMAQHLTNHGFHDVADLFEEEEISGLGIQYVTEEILEKIGVSPTGKRLAVLKILAQLRLTHTVSRSKVFNDPIHGHIELHPLCVKVIDTPQFQRLRFLKQLGACYFIFPGASHNRFEHCIGVCHLAGKFVRALQYRQPELEITEKDVLCVELAGLCHDLDFFNIQKHAYPDAIASRLGHGPFSHLFDGKFIKTKRKKREWSHEEGSTLMFDHLISENNLMEEFCKYGLDQTDCLFIKELIKGPPKKKSKEEEKNPVGEESEELIKEPLEEESEEQIKEPLEEESEEQEQKLMEEENEEQIWRYEGRPESKSFLYEIVANKRNHIDVDKWDYFARDCHHLGIKNNFDHDRYMKFARVLKVNDRFQICSRDKEVGNLYDMFHTRNALHRRAYQHSVNTAIEAMIVDALLKADDHFYIPGSSGKMKKMSQCVDDPVAFEKLTDSLFQQITFSVDPKLKESRNILNRILKRQLYKCVGQAIPRSDKTHDSDKLKQEILLEIKSRSSDIVSQDLVLHTVYLDYGMKDKNPIDNVRFYNKRDPNQAIPLEKNQVSKMLPEKFAEQYLRLYCKKIDEESIKHAMEGFLAWCDKNELKTIQMTPVKMEQSPTEQSIYPHTPEQQKNSVPAVTPSTAGKFKSRLSFE